MSLHNATFQPEFFHFLASVYIPLCNIYMLETFMVTGSYHYFILKTVYILQVIKAFYLVFLFLQFPLK